MCKAQAALLINLDLITTKIWKECYSLLYSVLQPRFMLPSSS
jgi:hypothetical protein